MTDSMDEASSSGPRKLLALDGGGIRGLITLGVLAEIERVLRVKLERGPDFVLADYFDFIGGTSTGAIIATGLALGKSVADLQDLYERLGPTMFKKRLWPLRLWAKFSAEPLTRELKKMTGAETTFGDPKLRTLLMMVLKNASTDSPWPLSNAPLAKYNNPSLPDCNLKFPLWQLVRASTAAPAFFSSEVIEVGDHRFEFVDGGVTNYNNPALAVFLSATMPEYGLGWGVGQKELLLVSVGTGIAPKILERRSRLRQNLIYNAKTIPSGMIFTMVNHEDLVCRALGFTRAGDPIDHEVGAMIGPGSGLPTKMFTYVRYNVDLTRKGLDGLGLTGVKPRHVAKLDSDKHMGDLRVIGEQLSAQVKVAHFEDFLE